MTRKKIIKVLELRQEVSQAQVTKRSSVEFNVSASFNKALN